MFNRKKTSSSEANALPGANSSQSSTDVLLRELAVDYMHDRKIRRRWKIGLWTLLSIYLIGILIVSAGKGGASNYGQAHTALVELNGVIGADLGATSDQINRGLRNAFEAANSKAVVLRINSPGGTPVQSAEINDEIKRLRSIYPNKPMYAVVSDLAASGGYFVAVAADKIFANRSSIVGSIGVRMDGFGFVDALDKLGIERRSLTAGENKAILDPFLPVKPAQRAHAKRMLDQVHEHFIEAVKEGRGDRISQDPQVYSGLFWSGDEAKTLGLVDDFASLDTVARDIVGAKDVVNYTLQPNFWEQVSREFGVSVGKGIASVVRSQFSLN